MSRQTIGYQHFNGSVEYIVTEWHISSNDLNHYPYDNYKTSESVLSFIRENTMETLTIDTSHKYLTYDYDMYDDRYLFASGTWYLLSKSFTLHFPKRLSTLLESYDDTMNIVDGMEAMEL